MCLAIGLAPQTECLATLWRAITAAQVQMRGLPGDDITVASMGVPRTVWSGFAELKKLNSERKSCLKEELIMLQNLLPAFKDMEPDLVEDVTHVVPEALAALN